MYRECKIFWLLVVSVFLTASVSMAQVSPKSYGQKMDPIVFNKALEEGFCAGTLIKIPDGYELIENLAIGDVVIDQCGNSTEIMAITRRCVHEYIQLSLEDITLCMGCDQQLYFCSKSSWIRARDIILSDSERIMSPIALYALTTQSHTLAVTSSDLVAHNAAALVLGAPNICLAYIAVINPVIAVLGGATMALAAVAYNARKTYLEMQNDEEGGYIKHMPDAIVLAERFYYEQRKGALEKIQQELMAIKNNLQIIKGLYSGSFTDQFLKQQVYDVVKNVSLLSTAQEKSLSDEQKNRLRISRENELALLEKQICDMQFLLALHVNQLIDNVQYVQAVYDSAIAEIRQAIGMWNNNLNAITPEAALRFYRYDLLREYLVYAMRQAFDEFLLVAGYYRICTNQCIQNSTTISLALDQIIPVIQEKKQWLVQEEECVRNNIAVAERYFAEHNISVIIFKNEAKKEFDKRQKDRNIQVLKNIENQVSVNSFPGGPKKDDDEDPDKKKRKFNIVSKSDFFKNVSKDYEHWRDGAYKRRPGTKGLGKKTEYLKWDHLHNDVEAYDKGGIHLGSYDPATLELYKGPVLGRVL